MPNYNQPHRYYCGVDLHARTLFVHILDDTGTTRLEQKLAASPAEPITNWSRCGCAGEHDRWGLDSPATRPTQPSLLGDRARCVSSRRLSFA
jgi:hypothetical protein